LRISLERAGKRAVVEVAAAGDVVTVDGHRFPVKVVHVSDLSVELEIDGERVVVDQWPAHFPTPPGPVDVNGERWTVRVEPGAPDANAAPTPRVPRPSMPSASTTPVPPADAPPGGIAVVPPMPGKILEVRVAEGDRVRGGDVLLVLEAMKMRNEVTSPADGTVRGLAVAAGANVRAKDPLLYVVPE